MKIAAASLLLAGAVLTQSGQAQSPRVLPRTVQGTTVGRFQIINVDADTIILGSPSVNIAKRVLLLDTATGRTWTYKEVFSQKSGVNAVGWDELGEYFPPDNRER